ncbi:MAG TPA: sigma-54 dependent transcriptional regulator [Thermoanaerobaculia bacterium]|nr:sigma-54 dependent transcriptional regulator [Thermoanaerobaculia bacterium]
MSRNKILVVDDDPTIRFGIGDFLKHRGFQVEEAANLEEAREALLRSRPDAMILDQRLPDGNAVEALDQLKRLDPDVTVVVLTGHGSIELAVQAVKSGADHFLTKPVELAALVTVLERTIENQRVRQSQRAVSENQARQAVDPFLGTSAAIRRLREEAMLALQSDSPVLIQGETGTGKGVLSRWLHGHGTRSEEALVDLNCAGLTREFLESELFGHVRGAFTTAVADKKGLLEVAHRGVLFLDEIGDTDLLIQAKLLKALEEKSFRRLGEVRDRRVDVQLVAATNRDLTRLCREGAFRSDLYYRISTLPLHVPPLRERREDIAPLAADLLRRLAAELKRGPLALDDGAVERLRSHAWPGNIRELRNVLERAALASRGGLIAAGNLRFDPVMSATPEAMQGDLTLEEIERLQIRRVLGEEHGKVISAAERLGVPRSTLYMKIKTYGIDLASFQS